MSKKLLEKISEYLFLLAIIMLIVAIPFGFMFNMTGFYSMANTCAYMALCSPFVSLLAVCVGMEI